MRLVASSCLMVARAVRAVGRGILVDVVTTTSQFVVECGNCKSPDSLIGS
jgi:hypothetical protein